MSTTSARFAPSVQQTSTITPADVGLLLLRVVVGLIVAGHGAQKLFGWFGGGGIDGTGQFFESVGYEPGRPLAVLAGLGEVGGGVLLAIGLLTPLAGATVTAVLLGALRTKYSGSGGAFFAQNQGYELELLVAAAGLSLALVGPGRIAVDPGRPWDREAVRYAAAAAGLALGVAAYAMGG